MAASRSHVIRMRHGWVRNRALLECASVMLSPDSIILPHNDQGKAFMSHCTIRMPAECSFPRQCIVCTLRSECGPHLALFCSRFGLNCGISFSLGLPVPIPPNMRVLYLDWCWSCGTSTQSNVHTGRPNWAQVWMFVDPCWWHGIITVEGVLQTDCLLIAPEES